MRAHKQIILLVLIILLAAVLRIWQLDKVPVSLFGDELDSGYQAYSILKTGKDYSGNFLPINFKSLAEWRTPFSIYLSVPTVAIFGISAWGVRLPNAIVGVLAILGLYLLVYEFTKNKILSLISAFLLAISPWHLQYSRTGFDGPEMVVLYIYGVYFLLTSFRGKNTLWLSAVCFALTPWAYNTAKLFLPLTLLMILIIWKDNLIKIAKGRLIWAIIIFSVITIPFAVTTIFGGGTERIQGISIFNDPTVIPQIGFDRLNDIQTRGGSNIQQASIFDKLFHNQITSYTKTFTDNYLQSFSTQFLFIKGDSLNPRQSSGIELYKLDFIFLILGLIFLTTAQLDKKIKLFLIFWLLMAPIPSALTQDGGDHATRLLLMLPVLIILIAFGIKFSYEKINKNFKVLFAIILSIGYLASFIFYQHDYWIHYPWRSERWWHAGYEEAVKSAVEEGKNYDRVIISSADEPSLKFFIAWSMYPPDRFQKEYNSYLATGPNSNSTFELDKYEFPPIGQGLNLYEMGSKLPNKTLYLATTKEINLNLIKEPGRVPTDLILIKSISYPSGEPAFYLFTRNEKTNTI